MVIIMAKLDFGNRTVNVTFLIVMLGELGEDQEGIGSWKLILSIA
jgi:hypothetical protein